MEGLGKDFAEEHREWSIVKVRGSIIVNRVAVHSLGIEAKTLLKQLYPGLMAGLRQIARITAQTAFQNNSP